VFLGDYVDRGKQSEENLQLLLEAKLEHPEDIILLAGNHEGFMVRKFYPANYWELLPEGQRANARAALRDIPSGSHFFPTACWPSIGALPEFKIPGRDQPSQPRRRPNWERMIWGDFLERDGEFLGEWGGRPPVGWRLFQTNEWSDIN